MAKKGSIRGNHDGKSGGNESYTIQGRGTVSRAKLVAEVKQGNHDGYAITTVNGREYVKSTPDDKESNNVNK